PPAPRPGMPRARARDGPHGAAAGPFTGRGRPRWRFSVVSMASFSTDFAKCTMKKFFTDIAGRIAGKRKIQQNQRIAVVFYK
ncbi:hypothetical protein AB0V92_33030, partial [Mesorhizobium ciceri]|uniref:hypothetical protein n=1 Tax=Mesorhizobium ciceri TaxID=39645 RepID=UPI00344C52DB